MYLDIPFEHREAIGNKLIEAGFENHAENFLRGYFGRDESKISIKIKEEITEEFLNTMILIAEELGIRGLLVQTRQSLLLFNEPETETIKTLKTFETGLASYLLRDAVRGWLFYLDYTENYIPYVVSRIEYKPADPRNRTEAQVIVSLDCNSPKTDSRRRDGKAISFTLSDVKGKTIPQSLSEQRYYKENQDLVDSYYASMKLYLQYQPMFGKQFTGEGMVDQASNGYSPKRVNLDGFKRVKMVNDDQDNNRESLYSTYTEYSFWQNLNAPEGVFEEIPFHPYIQMFDLNNHCHYWVLADKLSVYQYNPKLGDKLVLPEQQRDLIDILVDDMDVVMEDIVEGKSGGTTILCLGEPGVGKTLTAEIYSEVVERPLYRVHSGQLGTNPDKIEERLQLILERSEAWGSILLIDEADVYIRERDNSMSHNAIVAAFLRKLEYFNGLLFLTTNRADDVDDAIKSRAMAIVKYEKPKQNELKRIWQTLSAEFKMDLKESVIDELVEHYPATVGRDVKELLKLANKYHRRKGRPLDLETFRNCAIFRGISYR